MNETTQKNSKDITPLTPIKYLLFTIPVAIAAGLYAGNEIGIQEVAQHKQESLERNTAQDFLVLVKEDVPPNVVIEPAMVEVSQTFANRIEPDLATSLKAVVGKKTKFGLNKGQVVAKADLE